MQGIQPHRTKSFTSSARIAYLILPHLSHCLCTVTHHLAFLCNMWTAHDPHASSHSYQAYLSQLHFGGHLATKHSCFFFTCNEANQATFNNCNTKPRQVPNPLTCSSIHHVKANLKSTSIQCFDSSLLLPSSFWRPPGYRLFAHTLNIDTY